MSITSKIIVSAFLLGVSLPAFAQGSAASVGSPVPRHGQSVAPKLAAPAARNAMVHKAATTEPVKVLSGTTIKPVSEVESAKVASGTTLKAADAKSTVNTGIARPVSPAPVAPVVKTN